MAVAAVSRSPIFVFTKSNTWVEVPISAVSFVGKDIVIDGGFSDAQDDNVKSWVSYLESVGELWPIAVVPPVIPAMTIASVARGSTGNDIQFEIEYSASEDDKYSVTATKTDRYTGLTLDNVEATLLEKPGLVRVKECVKTAKLPVDISTPQSVESDGTLKLLDGDGEKALVLSTRGATADDLLVTVTARGDSETNTFSITASWSKAVTVDGTKDTAEQLAVLNGEGGVKTGLGYIASFTAPADAELALPRAGLFVLRGGDDAKRAGLTIVARETTSS